MLKYLSNIQQKANVEVPAFPLPKPEDTKMETELTPAIQIKSIQKLRDEKGKYVSTTPSKPGEPKTKKNKPLWQPHYKFIQVDMPLSIKHPKMKKKYMIQFKYIDGSTIHTKTVKFGDHEKDDFIDHKDITRREQTMYRIRNYDNPFKGNYWRYHLLNKYTTLLEAYTMFLKEQQLI